MKTRSILLLVLGLAMIQDQTSAANKHYLVESKGKQYLVETKGKTEKGKDNLTETNGKAKNGKGGGGERPLGEKLPNGFEVTVENVTYKLTGAIELHHLVLKEGAGYDKLKKRKDEITSTIIDSTCEVEALVEPYPLHFKEVTPLWLACTERDSKAALLLLSKGADPNKAAKKRVGYEDGDVSVETPLFHAARRGSTEVVRSLLASGARQDLDSGRYRGRRDSPLNMAKRYEHDEIVSLLESAQSAECRKRFGEAICKEREAKAKEAKEAKEAEEAKARELYSYEYSEEYEDEKDEDGEVSEE